MDRDYRDSAATRRVAALTISFIGVCFPGTGCHIAVWESLGPDDPQLDEGCLEETMSVAIFSLYTLARGIDMFTEPSPAADKPHLSEMGRATAGAALRAACIVKGDL
jgi:hypothetical protein